MNLDPVDRFARSVGPRHDGAGEAVFLGFADSILTVGHGADFTR